MLNRFLSLFRPAGARDAPADVTATERYEGFELQARPRRDGSNWRVGGRICRPGDPDGPHHDFVRVDTMASHDEAVQLSLVKARQLVDERGENVLPATSDD